MKKRANNSNSVGGKLDRIIAVMATKDDFKRFATKKDLERFATKDDIKTLATNDRLDKVIDAMATKDDIVRLEKRVGDFNEKFKQIIAILEGMAKAIADLRLEYATVSMQLSRHDQWIKEIAKKTGVKLV